MAQICLIARLDPIIRAGPGVAGNADWCGAGEVAGGQDRMARKNMIYA